MKTIYRLIILIFITFQFITSPKATELNECKKTVGMWTLMLWFNDEKENFYPWQQYVRLTPSFGSYNSFDKAWVEYTIDSAIDMGVDYLILDNTNGVFRHNGAFDKIIKSFIDTIRLKKSSLKIVIAKGYSIFEKKDLNLLDKSVKHLRSYFSEPEYLYIDGKPTLILYLNSDDSIVSLAKKSGRNYINYKKFINNNDFYGFRNYFHDLTIRYNSGYDSWITDFNGVYGWRFDFPQVSNKKSMGVMPGWDRSHNELTGSTPVDRNNGKHYNDSWNHVLSVNPCNVVITSWDDWAEETAIAPTKEWGSMYYQMTKEFIKKFKENSNSN